MCDDVAPIPDETAFLTRSDLPARAFAAFLFDMDGTILSSIAAAERVWTRWALRHGLDVAAFLAQQIDQCRIAHRRPFLGRAVGGSRCNRDQRRLRTDPVGSQPRAHFLPMRFRGFELDFLGARRRHNAHGPANHREPVPALMTAQSVVLRLRSVSKHRAPMVGDETGSPWYAAERDPERGVAVDRREHLALDQRRAHRHVREDQDEAGEHERERGEAVLLGREQAGDTDRDGRAHELQADLGGGHPDQAFEHTGPDIHTRLRHRGAR